MPPPRAGQRVVYVAAPKSSSSGCGVVFGMLVLVGIAGLGFFLFLGSSPSVTTESFGSNTVVATEPSFFEGDWEIDSATNPGSEKGYSGTVHIDRTGDVFTLAWDIKKSKPFRGVGLEVEEALAVGWGLGTQFGVAIYEIDGGVLRGRWATESSGASAGTEILSGPSSLDGTYTITTGTDPSGKSYEGKVIIKPEGQTYKIRWKLPSVTYTGSNDYSGVGIKHGNHLVFGWGAAGKGSGVNIYRKTGERLTGVWANPQKAVLGTENLTRMDNATKKKKKASKKKKRKSSD